MAYPFFQGENAGGDSDKLNEMETYHHLMLAYPGYTVEGIKEELSWRQIEELMKMWQANEPSNIKLQRIEEILKRAHGIKYVPRKAKDQNLMDELRGMGWL